MVRPLQFVEKTLARFVEGTFERIRRVLQKDEDRADFIRSAVERELKRREQKS